jgi:exopolysaccharide production protein ExoQ
MPPQLALLLTVMLIVFLFVRDRRDQPATTGALWVPLLWLVIICSRNVSEWVGFGGAIRLSDGSPLDSAVYLALELAGLIVLFRRRVSLSKIISQNPWFALFFLYGALSILWSDFPFVAVKRWTKALSHPIMLLVIATEPDPRQALVRLLKRTAYILVPLSIVLIKYYPELGRTFDPWSGAPTNTGVTTSKNGLGYDCLLLGFFFCWHFLTKLRSEKTRNRRNELYLSAAFLVLIGWLLLKSQSLTSIIVLFFGVSIVIMLDRGLLDKNNIRLCLVVALLVLCGIHYLGITDSIIAALGRDATLTGRTELWADVLKLNSNPLIGTGFESFWLGDRLERLWSAYWWQPNQAHNGYLETYLSLGWIGLVLVAVWILSGFRYALGLLHTDFVFARFAIGLLVISVLYNFTEATFKGLHPMWFAFYIAAMQCPAPVLARQRLSSYATTKRKGSLSLRARRATDPLPRASTTPTEPGGHVTM